MIQNLYYRLCRQLHNSSDVGKHKTKHKSETHRLSITLKEKAMLYNHKTFITNAQNCSSSKDSQLINYRCRVYFQVFPRLNSDSVIGVELFNGKFYFCTDESRITKETCVGEMVILHLDHAEVESREWQRHDFHFDNVIDAFLSLFTFSTGAGWPDGMWASIESTQELFHAHSYTLIQN